MASDRDRLLRTLRRHIGDARVLDAIAAVDRACFVPEGARHHAWDNVPLPIGLDQTISQPLIVARMCELLELASDERVLDVGTGSGYHAAVLAHLCAHVWSIERHTALSHGAATNLAEAGIANVTLLVGDGTLGAPEFAPFDAINVAAATPAVPVALTDQLAVGGRLVAPIGEGRQWLAVARCTGDGVTLRWAEEVRFVPLVGDATGESR